MTVTLNEVALAALLETEQSPVGRYVQGVAERITGQAQLNVRTYFAGAPSMNVDQDVGFSMDGSTATIGIRDVGRKARRLALAQAQGKVNWLTSAVEAGNGN